MGVIFTYVLIYVIIVFRDKKLYELVHSILIDLEQVKRLIILVPKLVLVEEYIFRILLIEFTNSFNLSSNLTNIIVSVIFSLSHYTNHTAIFNIYSCVNQLIYTFLMFYFFLSQNSVLASFLMHLYSDLICLLINYYIHKKYPNHKIN